MARNRLLAIAGSFLFMPVVAMAQDRPITVYFEPCDTQPLNNAIAAALTQPPFLLLTKGRSDALVVSIPDRIAIERQPKGAIWTFTVQFRRNGASLGQSVESCNEKSLSDCTDQLVSDVKSAAGMGP